MARQKGIYERYIKRPMDFFLALCALIVLSPLLLITAILVRTKLGAPVLFKQARPGKGERIFTIYKFRSMTNARDEDGNLLPDEDRLTKFGKLLRNTSIDELPELINIIKGDMSIVGPRPLLVAYLPLYSEEQRKRHNVRPGLTGLAQVNGRNLLTWEQKFDSDRKYVESISFILDLKIVFLTVIKVVSRSGISSEDSATMEVFTGSEKTKMNV